MATKLISKKTEDLKQHISADEALRKSEAKFRSYFELPFTGRCITSPEKGWIEVNQALCDMLGYTKEEFLSMTWEEQTHPDDIPKDIQKFKKVMDGEIEGYSLEKRFIHKDGHLVFAHLAVQCIRKQDNSVDYFIAIIIDISEQKKAEESLRESELKLSTMFEVLPVGVSVLDGSRNIVYANTQLERILGIPKSDILEGKYQKFKFITRDNKRMANEEFASKRSVKENMVINNVETGIVKEDGSVVWTNVSAVPVSFLDWKTIIVTSDITERKKAEQALKQSEYRYKKLFDNSLMSVTVIDREGYILLVNDVAAKNFGGEKEQIIGRSIGESLSEDVFAKYIKLNKELIDSGCNREYEDTFVMHGKEITFLILDTCLFDESGKGYALLSTSIDITERKKAEAEVRHQKEELEKINSEKDKFFSIIAHDLRSPFTGFLGFTQLMVSDINKMSLSELNKIAFNLHNSANKIYSLLTNLLEWAMMQRGMTVYSPEKLFLKEITDYTINISQESAEGKGVEILNLIEENISVQVDKAMIETVMRNLLSNAVKFTNRGGKVIISAKTLKDKVEISVKDSGIGMSKEIVIDLFRIDKKTGRLGTEKEPSSGLGLLLCKEFVEKHNGTIRIESEEGKGSEFVVSLPV